MNTTNDDEEKAFHDLGFLTVKFQIHILPFIVFLGLLGRPALVDD